MTNDQITGKRAAEAVINNGQGGRFCGYVCGANCISGISQSVARTAAVEAGLAEDLGWPRLKSNNYYRRAISAAVSSGRRDERRFEAVKVEDSDDRIVHVIVRKEIAEGLVAAGSVVVDAATGELRIASNEARFGEEFKIQFDKDKFRSGAAPEDLVVYEDRAKCHPVAAEIGRIYTEAHGTFKADDVRAAFSRAFRAWGAVPLLDHAGMWFVPATHEDHVRRWYAWMLRIGCQPCALRQRAGEDQIGDESISRASTAGVTNQLTTLERELDAFAAADNTRFSTLEKHVERFAELRRLVAVHDELLGIRREKLAARLAEAQTRWLAKLIEIAEAEEPEDENDAEVETEPAAAGGCI